MADNYFIINCEDPDDGYLARLSYTPDDPRRSWILGERFETPPPIPVRATVRGLDDDDTVLAELWKSPLPAMSKRLHAVLVEAGVSNLEVFPLEIMDPSSGKLLHDHVAFNLIGKVAAVDVAASVVSASNTDKMVSASFDQLALDEQRIGGALMFRLAEAVSTIVVHRSVKERIESAGIQTLTFYVPKDWTT